MLFHAKKIIFGDYSGISDNDIISVNFHVNKLKKLMVQDNASLDLRTSCVESFDYFKQKPEILMVLFIRELVRNDVIISSTIVPEIIEIADDYSEIIIQARNF